MERREVKKLAHQWFMTSCKLWSGVLFPSPKWLDPVGRQAHSHRPKGTLSGWCSLEATPKQNFGAVCVFHFPFLYDDVAEVRAQCGTRGGVLWLQQKVSTNIDWMPLQRFMRNSDGQDKVQTWRNSNAGRHICQLLQHVAHG